MSESRTEKRRHLSELLRIERLEEDQDGNDKAIDALAGQIAKLNGILLGILISIVSGVTVVVLTLAVTR